MALTPFDRTLVQRCLAHEPGSWNDFVDRFLGLVYHTINYTAYLRSVPLSPEDHEDIASEVLLQIVADDYKVLREFRGQASLATYLAVIARRIAAHELSRRGLVKAQVRVDSKLEERQDDKHRTQAGLENLEEVQKLLSRLRRPEREVVRLFYLEGRSYEEISTRLNIPVNSIGPVLSRARRQLRDDTPPRHTTNGSAAEHPKVPRG